MLGLRSWTGGSGPPPTELPPPIVDVASEGQSDTTSTSFIEKLTTGEFATEAGRYLILYDFELFTDSGASRLARSQVQIDNANVIRTCESAPAQQDVQTTVNILLGIGVLDPPVSVVQSGGGFYLADLTAGTHFVDIDWLRASAAGTASIRRARIAVWRIN